MPASATPLPHRPLHYVELEPGAGVRDLVLAYWGFTVHALPTPGFMHRLWPEGSVGIVLVFADVAHDPAPRALRVVGPRRRVQEVPVARGSHFWGIRFRPEAGAAWLGMSARALRDANLDAAATLGARARELARGEALRAPSSDATSHGRVVGHLDGWVASSTSAPPVVDPLVRDAVRDIVACDGQEAIATLAARHGVTPRTLQRRFQDAVGLSPKEFAVMRRGRAALKRVVNGESRREAGGWTALADAAGFADQAHLTRELARLTRLSPRALRDWLDTIEHGALVD